VLEARDFPLERLARGLDISAVVVTEQFAGPARALLAETLTGAATYVRSLNTSLEGLVAWAAASLAASVTVR
jgi:hypothetical protein